jgi:hypothetical protein
MRQVAKGEGDFSAALAISTSSPGFTPDSPHVQDEINVLVCEFNEMLAQIQSRDSQLKQHEAHLEEEVAERTAELRTANGRLISAKEAYGPGLLTVSHGPNEFVPIRIIVRCAEI